MTNIKIILGSTKQGRMSEKVGTWFLGEVQKYNQKREAENKDGIAAEILDLRDYPMPFIDDAALPMQMNMKYPDATVQKWSSKIAEGDAFVVVAPEYNHGYPAVLKNALDHLYSEWARKTVGFISYGGSAGARSVEQLKQVVINLQLIPIQSAIQIKDVWSAFDEQGVLKDESLNKNAANFLDQFMWMTDALKNAKTK